MGKIVAPDCHMVPGAHGMQQMGTIMIHEHTRVGTGFIGTVLVTAHCPTLNAGIVVVPSVPSALASNVPGLKCSAYHMPSDRPLALSLPQHPCVYSDVRMLQLAA